MMRIVLAGIFLTLSFFAQSKNTHDKNLLDQANMLFSKGDYEQALREYSAIRESDTSAAPSESLRYNIAVCHYKMKQWQQARALFTQLHNERLSESRFTYSLAVVEKNLGNTERAAALFLEVSALGKDQTLAEAARKQYQLLQPSSKPFVKTRLSKPLNLSIELNAGNDNNVLEPSDLSGTGRSDRFTEAIAMVSWHSDGTANKRWLIDGFGYSSRYDSVDEYDFDMLDIGLRKYSPTDFGRWYWGVRSNATVLGGEGYLQSSSAQLGAQGWLEDSYKWKAGYQYKNHRSLNEQFDPFAGDAHRFDLEFAGSINDKQNWKLAYRYEFDDRDDLDLGDLFTSYSAQRHSLQAEWGLQRGHWRNKLSANYRSSDYMDTNLMLDGNIVSRKDQRMKLSARSSWALFDDWTLSAEYSFTDNKSNIETYDYDRHMLLFGVRWDW
ncbi:MAG: tetratricopeptide repeat protein, partial [Pseudomonadales bacterium]